MSSGMLTEQQPSASNGTPAPAVSRAPVADRMATRAALRESLVKGEDVAAPADAPVTDPSPAVDATGALTAEPAAAKVEAAKVDAVEHDPETEKRLAKVLDAEKRGREKLAAERKAFDVERAKAAEDRKALDEQRSEFDEFRKLKERAKLDPVAALRALGIADPAELDYAAKQAYAAAKSDPGNKEAAARMMREREAAEKIGATEKRLAELEQKIEQREQHATIQRQAEDFMANVMKIADANPLAKHVIAKDPDHANRRLRQIAYDLAQELEDIPDADDVLARFEAEERKAFARYGVDPTTILSPSQAGPKKNDQPAEKKNAAPTLSNDLSTPRVPRTRETERERRESVRAALESGKLD